MYQDNGKPSFAIVCDNYNISFYVTFNKDEFEILK